jgi:hypothetical protein
MLQFESTMKRKTHVTVCSISARHLERVGAPACSLLVECCAGEGLSSFAWWNCEGARSVTTIPACSGRD